jgi:hypothetical protein
VESRLGSFCAWDRRNVTDGNFTLSQRAFVSANGISVVRLETEMVLIPGLLDGTYGPIPGIGGEANRRLYGETRSTYGKGAWRAQLNKLRYMPVGTFGKFMFFEYLESITFFLRSHGRVTAIRPIRPCEGFHIIICMLRMCGDGLGLIGS